MLIFIDSFGVQVALIVYMAQMGSFVPADYARIGIVDRIYTRIRTRDLVSSVRHVLSEN